MLRNILFFIKNLYHFRKALWQYRRWDYHYILAFQKKHLKLLRYNIEHSYAQSVNWHNQVKHIDEMLGLIDRIEKDDYHYMYYTFEEMEFRPLDDGMFQIVDIGVRNKAGVNHKRVSSGKQKQQDWNRLNYLIDRYGQGLWS